MSVYAIGEYHLTEEELAENKFEFDLSDVIYTRLDPLEAKLQQLQDRRILDNQYLFSVSPIGRRWYELMAAKIFGVVTNNGQFCEIRYAWYIKHHHTLKRLYERFRVVEQMNRVIRDHVESGYIAKVEYRAIKEPDQEIDYVIRYYPGPGAKDSNVRIQSFIRERRNHGRRQHVLREPKTEIATATTSEPTLALSVVTSTHRDLAGELILRFRINPLRATDLVLTHAAAVKEQLDAWPFRQVKARSISGWMIQAIENNYELPESFRQYQQGEGERQARDLARNAIAACDLCDDTGYRYVKTATDFHGAMRQCSHDPEIESKIASDAQIGTLEGSELKPRKIDLPALESQNFACSES